MHRQFLVLFFLSLFVCFSSFAQQPLTRADVQNAIEAYKEFYQEFSQSGKYDYEQMNSAIAQAKGQQIYNKYISIVKRHGFDDPADWWQTFHRMIQAYTTIKIQEQNPQMQAQMQQQMAEIQNNPDLSPQQKQQVMQMMQQSMQGVQSYYNAPAADVEAVKPFTDQIARDVTQEK